MNSVQAMCSTANYVDGGRNAGWIEERSTWLARAKALLGRLTEGRVTHLQHVRD